MYINRFPVPADHPIRSDRVPPAFNLNRFPGRNVPFPKLHYCFDGIRLYAVGIHTPYRQAQIAPARNRVVAPGLKRQLNLLQRNRHSDQCGPQTDRIGVHLQPAFSILWVQSQSRMKQISPHTPSADFGFHVSRSITAFEGKSIQQDAGDIATAA